MNKLILVAMALGLAGCGEVGFGVKKEVLACSVEDTAEGALITCADGSSTVVNDGTNGDDGLDGIDGLDGSAPFKIVDPCGDGPGADEVVLVFESGEILAWYKNLGLSELQEGLTYVTTDQQKCKFKVLAGEVVEL